MHFDCRLCFKKIILAILGLSGGHMEALHLTLSMIVLVYFVIITFCLISHGLCFEYIVAYYDLVHIRYAFVILFPDIHS